jgi:hypothetical protein
MTVIDELSPDRRAVLSLILRRGRSYAEIATALQIDEDTVREHAYTALSEIAGESADGLAAHEREQIGDYLLGQQSSAERLVSYDELEGSAAARAFANTLARELEPLAAGALPEVPGRSESGQRAPRPERTARARRRKPPAKQAAPTRRAESLAAPVLEPEEAPEPFAEIESPAASRTGRGPREAAPVAPRPDGGARTQGGASTPSLAALPSSRLGGAIVLALIVVAAVVAIVLASTSGGGSARAKSGATAAAGTTGSSAAGAGQVRLNKQIKLTPPSGGSALGAAAVLSESGRYVVALAAEHLRPTQGFFYAAWLYNSPSQAFALGKAPSVSSSGQLKPVAQALPENAGQYHQLLITKETNEHPSQPGETVLSGPFSLH